MRAMRIYCSFQIRASSLYAQYLDTVLWLHLYISKLQQVSCNPFHTQFHTLSSLLLKTGLFYYLACLDTWIPGNLVGYLLDTWLDTWLETCWISGQITGWKPGVITGWIPGVITGLITGCITGLITGWIFSWIPVGYLLDTLLDTCWIPG